MSTQTAQQVDDLLLFCDDEAFNLLKQMAKEHNISEQVVRELLAWERGQQERKNAYGRTEYFDQVLDNDEYWSIS